MFSLARHGTTLRTECLAGVTTFLTMAYILFLNPEILAAAGMDRGAVFVATCLAAAVGSAIMGLLANYPVALAPGMGLNAFFAYTVVLTYGYSWQQALAAVLVSGLLFVLLSLSRAREVVIEAFPRSLRLGIAAGLGLFLGAVALRNGGLIVDHPETLTTLANLAQWPALLMMAGFVFIVVLSHRGVTGATLLGILAVTAAALPLGLAEYTGVVAPPPDLGPTLFAFEFPPALEWSFLITVFTLLFLDVFDTAGTLIGVSHAAGLADATGRLPRLRRALLADSLATVFGALVGTSTTTSYMESAAGTAVGGRTGLTALVTAGCFLLALFLEPLAATVPPCATAAALLFVACHMTRGLTGLDWDDLTDYVPALVTAIVMPLAYSIAAGIGLGLVTHVLVKLLAGRRREVSPALVVLALAFCLFFALEGRA